MFKLVDMKNTHCKGDSGSTPFLLNELNVQVQKIKSNWTKFKLQFRPLKIRKEILCSSNLSDYQPLLKWVENNSLFFCFSIGWQHNSVFSKRFHTKKCQHKSSAKFKAIQHPKQKNLFSIYIINLKHNEKSLLSTPYRESPFSCFNVCPTDRKKRKVRYLKR